ncbi:Rossmann-like and DUF2520 domain-containing protein [Brumimicrobium aurantiacum]|uniref:DUF2520 domain-containing protein n=1 Tax=Brumimicrobium aurantiacum TaxID=1737063 RepID=A0A3E1EYR0_9FLAO|nr:Rossmann-like and DUF2520 domain-containing protein [Brumimicrobium aurantiacum]RFC54678.1 DUF2520 domain-containing protein [Brumimicrobium aurantiacum]
MERAQNQIIIIGTGNIAHNLGLHLKRCNQEIKGVWGRDISKAKKLSQKLESSCLTDLNKIQSDDLAIICVSDVAIATVLSQINIETAVAYTSGSVKLNDLPQREKIGVLYPLQTFSKNRNIDISNVPFLIESENEHFKNELIALAETLSSKVIEANSDERYNIHIAAVMVNNFTNFLYYLSEKQMREHQLDFDLLLPLIRETVNKLDELSPAEAQTGPAKRGDKNIIEQHLKSIQDQDTQKVYRLMSELIQKK